MASQDPQRPQSVGLFTSDGIRAIGGLIAVVVGVLSITAIAAIVILHISSGSKTEMVAVATSAFGVVSTVVGAYLGVKIGADQATQAQSRAELYAAQLDPSEAAAVHQALAARPGVQAPRQPGGG